MDIDQETRWRKFIQLLDERLLDLATDPAGYMTVFEYRFFWQKHEDLSAVVYRIPIREALTAAMAAVGYNETERDLAYQRLCITPYRQLAVEPPATS